MKTPKFKPLSATVMRSFGNEDLHGCKVKVTAILYGKYTTCTVLTGMQRGDKRVSIPLEHLSFAKRHLDIVAQIRKAQS